MKESRHWSRFFGSILNNYDPSDPAKIEEQQIYNYLDWVQSNVPSINKVVSDNAFDNEPHFSHLYPEISFHIMNSAMIDMWINFKYANDQEPNPSRLEHIKNAQDLLAISGYELYMKRQKLIDTDPDYFNKKNRLRNGLIDGRLNEIDSAIVLLSYIKNEPTKTVVPSPIQFERSNIGHRQGNTNSDILMYDYKKDDVIGIQLKNTVNEYTLNRYDKSRIVLISGQDDLLNQKVVRKNQSSSDKSIVSWPGLISMFHITKQMGTTGSSRGIAANYLGDRNLMRMKFDAKYAIGKISDPRQRALANIKPRLDNAFSQN